jgi:hypothetical protein
MSCLRCLCLFVSSGVQHILCCVFVLFDKNLNIIIVNLKIKRGYIHATTYDLF